MSAARPRPIALLLKYPLFILLGLALLAGVAWRWNIQPTKEQLPATLATALKRFYTDPNFSTANRATDAARNYRQSFADAQTDDLLAPAYVVRCNVELECQQKRTTQQNALKATEQAAAARFAHLPKDSPEHRAAITEALALDRSVPFGEISKRIDRHKEAEEKEVALAKLQVDFFRVIDDLAVPKNYLTGNLETATLLRQYLDKYVNLARDSYKFIAARCEPFQYELVSENPTACNAAMAEYNEFKKRLKQQATDYFQSTGRPPTFKTPEHAAFVETQMKARAAAVKKLISDREAPYFFIQNQLVTIVAGF